MSLTSMMSEDVKRRLRANASAEGLPAVQEKDNTAAAALQALEKYIPTEVLALYIPAVSIAPAIQSVLGLDVVFIYRASAVLTFAFAMGTYMSQMKANNLPLPSWWRWPWWKAVFATIAFLVWGLTITRNPYISTPDQIAVVGFGALFVSITLNFIATFFEPKA
jgi:hypothetical protein